MPAPPPIHPTPRRGPGPDERAEIVALHGRCSDLVDRLAPRLPEPDARRVRAALRAGEWLYLLNDLCAALVDDHVPITAEERALLAAAIDLVGLGDDTAPRLRDPGATLAAITVT